MKSCQRISRTIRNAACAAVTAFVTMLGGVDAAELNPDHVPADAAWLIHIDQEKLSDLEVVQELRDRYPELADTISEWFDSRYGFDPREDLRSLTMFSRDYRRYTGTVLLQTEYDEDKLKALLRKSDGLKKTEWRGHTFYTVTLAKHDRKHRHREHHHGDADERRPTNDSVESQRPEGHDRSGGKQMTVFFGNGLVVLASSVPNAKSYLRVLEGEEPSLKGTDSPLIAEYPAGAVIYGAAIELERLDRYRMLMPLLQQQEQCVYAFGERDGKLFETLALTGQSNDVAEKTTEVLEGLIAYEQLCAAGSKPLTKLMSNVRLTRSGAETSVTWEGDSELVVAAVRDLGERVDQWMKLLDIPGWRSDEVPSREVGLASRARPRETRLARRAWLGAMIRAAGDVGVEVTRIYLDSPADQAGLKAGDRITQIDGEDVSSPQVVAQRIAKLEPGTEVNVVVERDGQEMTVEVEIGNLEDFHERLFGKRFRGKFDDFHEMFDPDFDGIPEEVLSFPVPLGEDDEVTLRELLREMREELRDFRQEFRMSNGGNGDSSSQDEVRSSEER